MALPREYLDQECGLARALEIVGERWTLLILRDAFYGVRRFSDFRDHLGIPRAVLSERLRLLVEHGVLEHSTGANRREEYTLTDKGEQLWPAMWSLLAWGNQNYLPASRRRPFTHTGCGGVIDARGVCDTCGALPGPNQLTINPRPGRVRNPKPDPVSRALATPHPLLTPIQPAAAP